ncbi:MAG: ABC transporter substrate-binding protein [Deltaproteobacteria bacterium]|nr:ABC transporter substrate-binding protein [Deltaproteobacteria bacterium]
MAKRVVFFVVLLLLASQAVLYAQPSKKIRISTRGLGLSVLPYMIGQRLGFYRAEGLDAETIVTRGTVAIQTLIASSVDYTNALPIPAILRGIPLKVLTVISDKPSHYIVGSPKMTNLKQLIGKTIGISDFSGNSYLILRDVLQKAGIPIEQVQLRPIGEGSVRMMAVLTGVVDASILSPEETIEAQAKGCRVLAYSGDYISSLVTSLVTSDAKIKTVPEEVHKTVKATIKAQLFIFLHPEEAAKFLMENLGTSDVRLARNILEELSKRASDLARRGVANEEAMRSNVDRVVQQLQLTGAMPKSKEITLDQVYDFSFAKRAYEEISAEGWDPRKYGYSKKN